MSAPLVAAGKAAVRVASVGSTNDLARALAAEGAPHGTWVLADEQTGGRGRLGRRWALADGGVAASVLLRPRLPLADVPLLCLAAAEAVARLDPRLGIKWPNDVLLPDGRKVSGILAECEANGGSPAVIVGIGINLGAAPDLPTAGCLADLPGWQGDRDAVAAAVVTGLIGWCAALEAAGPLPLVAAWTARSCTLGARVRVGAVEGVATHIDATGTLWVTDDHGSAQAIRAGDVELVRAVR